MPQGKTVMALFGIKLPKLSSVLGTQVKASPYRANQQQAVQSVSGLLPSYQNKAQAGAAGFSATLPDRQAAYGKLKNYYATDPNGDAMDSMHLSQAYGRNADTFDAARAGAGASLRRRGISGGEEAGAIANIDARQGAANAGVNYNVAQDAIKRRADNLRAGYGLAGSEANYYNGLENQGLQGQASNLSQQYNLYGNLAQQDEARKAQESAATLGTVTGIGGLLGSYLGGRKATASGTARAGQYGLQAYPAVPGSYIDPKTGMIYVQAGDY